MQAQATKLVWEEAGGGVLTGRQDGEQGGFMIVPSAWGDGKACVALRSLRCGVELLLGKFLDVKEAQDAAELLSNAHLSGYTPGPWHIYDNGFFYDIKVPWQGRSVVEDHSPSICQVFYSGCDKVLGLPNARLIAAAPELLTVLKSALWNVERVTNGGKGATPDMAQWLDEARAVVAKVEGNGVEGNGARVLTAPGVESLCQKQN